MYLLLDANVVAGYYLPRSMNSKRARDRIAAIIDSVRSQATNHFLYIPNICIAEVFAVFAKHAFGRWNPHVKKTGTIDGRVYGSLVKQFRSDIHNGSFFYQYELSRYHVLGVDLVAPIDHKYQITRGKKQHRPAGTMDHLIVSMAIQLGHIHGVDNVALVTADQRLVRLVNRCRTGIPANVVKKLKLHRAKEVTGRDFSPSIFPVCLNLVHCTAAELSTALGAWPLPTGAVRNVYRWTKT